jgi:hypothetical protein
MTVSALQFIDVIGLDGERRSGLVPIDGADISYLSIDEQVAIFDAKMLGSINFIFFRRFSDDRSSQVAAYVIDNSDERFNEKQLAEIHLQVWLHGKAPLLYIAGPSRIDLLTCARGPVFWEKNKNECRYKAERQFDAKAIGTAAQIADELHRLADGTFWDDARNQKLADHDKAAHQLLIKAVVDADTEIDGRNNPILRRLLLLMVLIKYLEDRRVFPDDWFGKFHEGAQNFFEVLQGGSPEEVYRLLSELEAKFNGDIFAIQKEERSTLTRDILNRFAALVSANTIDKQIYLWKQFSFEHLPVEIISHLYQKFIYDGVGAVYTPPILATLLLDHVMPYEKITGKERVLDPACGSGVFLVGAFRRLINIWRSQNNWQCPDVETLKELLKSRIYGIEIDKNAIDLTAFSLCLAVCDALKPRVIWKELKFDPLRGSNLIEADFFQVLLDCRNGRSTALQDGIDVIVGNPPFGSNLTPAGLELDHCAGKIPDRPGLPDKQMAYLFLEQALSVLRPGGRACMIQPYGFLYNSKSGPFRTAIFRKYRIDTIFDFASIRNLFEADAKTIAVLAHADGVPENHWIKHWTFRRTVSVQERICFELDHYDRHCVSQDQAIAADSHVWRQQLLGGGRLIDMARRFSKMRKLSDYIKRKQEWVFGEGFIVGKGAGRKKADFLTGKPLLPTNAFTKSGINRTMITKVEETLFESPRTEKHFSAPLVLIKEHSDLPVAFWDSNQGPLAYKHEIVGIHAPRSEKSELCQIYDNLRSHIEFYKFSCALNGTRSLLSKATEINKQDIDNLPYPDDFADLTLSFWENALAEDTLNYITEYVRLGQKSNLLQTCADSKHMREYSDMFIRMLGSIYNNLKHSEPVYLNGLICQPFYFGESPDLSWLGKDLRSGLQKLIYDNYDDTGRATLRTIRVFRYYSENVLLIVKPDRLRYWIRSVAIRDADETLLALREQGY